MVQAAKHGQGSSQTELEKVQRRISTTATTLICPNSAFFNTSLDSWLLESRLESHTSLLPRKLQAESYLEESHDPRQTMASILDLPIELLVEILSCIQDKSTLCSLSLVSSALQKLAEPFLYCNFKNHAPLSLQLFLRTIIQRPSLSSHVRQADLSWHLSHSTTSQLKYTPPQIEVSEHLWRTLSNLQLDRDPNFLRALSEDPVGGEIFFLMILLPRLEELRLVSDESTLLSLLLFPDCELHFPKVLSQLTLNLRTLRKLIVDSGGLDPCPMNFLPWLQLPVLESFKGVGIKVTNWNVDNGCPGISKVTSLSLNNSVIIGRENATAFLSACKSLKSFTYISLERPEDFDKIDPREVINILQKHASSTLEHLKYFGCDDDPDGWLREYSIDPDDVEAFMISLRHFWKLTTLEVDQTPLLGASLFAERHPEKVPKLVDILPPNLTSLTIHYCGRHALNQLLEFAAKCREHFPNLKSVSVTPEWGAFDDTQLLLLLTSTFEMNHVNFQCRFRTLDMIQAEWKSWE